MVRIFCKKTNIFKHPACIHMKLLFLIIFSFFFLLLGDIYTGLHDGRIVKILKSGEIKEIARTGENHQNCGNY